MWRGRLLQRQQKLIAIHEPEGMRRRALIFHAEGVISHSDADDRRLRGSYCLSSATHGEGRKLGRLRVSLSTLAALREPRRTSGHEARKGRAADDKEVAR